MSTLYNEHDPFAAARLRELVADGLIAPGIVDERSIEDIRPDELAGFTQCHWFAGIGGWSAALRLAGVPDDYPLWTGSCPCQPFSAAGKGGGFADERHLWPAFDWLIGQCRPDLVLGEQVEGPAGRAWLDLVATDLEGHGYAFGTAVFPAAGVGAPQIRHRTYWVANAMRAGWTEGRPSGGDRQAAGRGSLDRLVDAEREGLERYARNGDDWDKSGRVGEIAARYAAEAGGASRLACPDEGQRGRLASSGGREPDRQAGGWQQGDGGASGDCEAGGVADARSNRESPWYAGIVRRADSEAKGARSPTFGARVRDVPSVELPGPVNGFWRASDWLYCRDDKWRPVEPFFESMADGVAARLGRLRPDIIAQTETEVSRYALEFHRDAAADVFDLWRAIPSATASGWKVGTDDAILSSEVLFAFLCQLSVQGWSLAHEIPCSRGEISGRELRKLWDGQAVTGASCGRELAERRPIESPNPLHLLSSILAQNAHAGWGEAVSKNAADRFPLMSGAKNRVGRLRAYGNAICVPQAQAFIEAVMST